MQNKIGMGVIKKQGIQNTIVIYTGIIIGFISLLFIQPQLLSPTELGLIRVLLSFSSLLAAVLPLGSPNINVKYLPKFFNAQQKHHGFFGLMLLFPLAGIIIGCGILFLLKNWIIGFYSEKSPLFTNYFYLVAPLAIFITFIYSFNSYCNAIFKTVFPSFLNDILNRVLFIAIILLYFFKWIDLDEFVLSFTLIYGIQTAVLFVYVLMTGNPGFRPDIKFTEENVGFRFILRYGLIVSFTTISSVSLKFLDSVFLAKYNLESVGIYSVAAFIALIIETPLNSLERIANSKISHHLAENNHGEIKKIYFTSSRYLMLLGGFLLVMVIVNIHDMLLLLPPVYQSGEIVTIIISVGAFVNMATGVNYPILMNSSKYVWGSVFLLVLLVTAIVGNWIMIDVLGWGILGAAIATSFSSAFYNLLKFLFIWKNFRMQPFNIQSLKIIFCIVISLAAGWFLPLTLSPITNMLLRSLAVILTYGTFTYFFNIVPEFHSYIPFLNSSEGKRN